MAFMEPYLYQKGRLYCADCSKCGRQYAARYSANGYMDCTDWHYGKNKRELMKEIRDLYGDSDD